MSLKGKVVIVSGSSKGIGFEIAKEFAEEKKSHVVICSRNVRDCEAASSRIKGSTIAIGLDVTDESSIENFLNTIKKEMGGIDILVNNSGYPFDNSVWNKKPHEVTISELEKIISVDLFGAFRLSRGVIPIMLQNDGKTMNKDINQQSRERTFTPNNDSSIEQREEITENNKINHFPKGGVIITISSTPALSGQPGGFPYSIAKAGNIALTKCLAKEYGGNNIRAYTLALGNISTKATINSMSEDKKAEAVMESPMHRWGKPIEVAKVASSIASEDFSFASGNTIIIDGGTIIM